MKDGLRQCMAWLHTWAGLVFGWLLFVIFLSGTIAVFDTEITSWMKPEMPSRSVTTAEALEAAVAHLEATAPGAAAWRIMLPDRRQPSLIVRGGTAASLDPATGAPVTARQTQGGGFFLRFHYTLHLDRAGIWIVGASGMAMLAALVSGVIVHRRIFRDLFTFRPGMAPARAWLDAHNLTGVFLLPFHLMIAYTGVAIFYFTYMPAGLQALYGGDERAHFAEMAPAAPQRPASGVAARRVKLAPLVAQAEALFGEAAWLVTIAHPGDAQSAIEIHGHWQDRVARINDYVVFDATTGTVLASRIGAASPVYRSYRVMAGLHRAQFGDYVVRWLYFVSGLAGTVTIVAALVLWTVKRREASGASRIGVQIVERLNVGTVVGLSIACAAFFWANRLLPAELAGRAAWEVRILFLVWAATLLHAVLRPSSSTWREQLAVAAAAYGLLPLLNVLTTDRHLGVSLPAGDWVLAGFDLTMLASGLVFAAVAAILGRRRT